MLIPWWEHNASAVAVVALSFLFVLPTVRALTMQASILTTLSKPNNAQVLLCARQIRSSGTDITRSLELLKRLTNGSVLENGSTETSIQNYELYESVYLEALAVVSRAKRKHQQSFHLNNRNCEDLQQIALKLYEQCPTDACRARTISIFNNGANNETVSKQSLDAALHLLQSGIQPPSIQSYHATLSVWVTAKDWKQALHMVKNQMTVATTLSWNIVFTAMCRAKQGYAAQQLLYQMIGHQYSQPILNATFAPPDRNTFHLTMNALIVADDAGMLKSASNNETRLFSNIDNAYNLLNSMLLLDKWYASNLERYSNMSVRPNDATFDLLVSAYGRKGEWDKVNFLSHLLRQYQTSYVDFTFPDIPSKQLCEEKVSWDPSGSNSFSSLRIRWENEGMVKQTKEKFWKIGTFSDPAVPYSFTVALQPNRNPSKNGIKLLLCSKNSDQMHLTKVGYLIMINSLANNGTTLIGTSTLLGMYLDPLFRQRGLSKIMIAIWLDLCHHANAVPRTGVMKKPLLALVLQHTFQFVPDTNTKNASNTYTTSSLSGGGGVTVEISPGLNASIGLYASNLKCLQGAFSLRDMKRENIVFLTEPPTPRGRLCRIGTTFVKQPITVNHSQTAGSFAVYDEIVKQQLLGKTQTASLVFDRTDLCWRQVFFGDDTGRKTS